MRISRRVPRRIAARGRVAEELPLGRVVLDRELVEEVVEVDVGEEG